MRVKPARNSRAVPRALCGSGWSKEQLASAWRAYERRSDVQKEIAHRRQRALLAVETMVGKGLTLLDARILVSDQLRRSGHRGGSARTLARWAAAVEGAPRDAWVALLLPDYLGRATTVEMPQEAWDLFKSDYLRPEAPSASGCYERLARVAAKRGWQLPSCRTFERRLEREIPHQAQVLARQGEEALMRMFPAQERDHTVFHALQAVNADGHKFDVFVRFPNDVVARPIMVGVQDLLASKILSRRVAETESADLARLAFKDVVERYGIPSHAWLDNGRGFASKMLTGGVANRFRFKVREEDPTGVLVNLGITIHWATPYHGQAKPIERAWRDFCDRVSKHPALAGAYTGNKPDAKPENYGSRAVPLDEFMRVLDEEILAHNARKGRRGKAVAGRSFDEVFNESYRSATIRRATAEQLRQMLLSTEVVTASAQDGSVRLAGNRYWSEALTQHAGGKVQLRFDPDHLHQAVSVYSLAGVFVGEADCIAAVGFDDVQSAKDHARAKKSFLRATRDQLNAERRLTAAEVASRLPKLVEPETPVPSVVAPLFGVSRGAPVARPSHAEPSREAAEQRFQKLMARMASGGGDEAA